MSVYQQNNNQLMILTVHNIKVDFKNMKLASLSEKLALLL